MSDGEMCFTRSSILKVLRTLNSVVVSLDRIGSTTAGLPATERDRILAEFVIEWDVTRKLAAARQLLSEPFSDELGDDDMDELEREMRDVPYWSDKSRAPPQSG